tara:strand:+ start:774 stop:965 length:192 start_codon:yes stop_codon:yes gene_type:complete
MEKLGAPRSKVTALIAAGHAKNEKEAEEMVRRGLFEKLMGVEETEKIASRNDLQEQLNNTLED